MARDHRPGDDATVFLGEDLLAWLVLAIGAALADALAAADAAEAAPPVRFLFANNSKNPCTESK